MSIDDISIKGEQELSPLASDWRAPAQAASEFGLGKHRRALEQQLHALASQLRECEDELEHTEAALRRQRHQLLEQARELEAAVRGQGRPRSSADVDDLEKRRLEVHLRARSAIAELAAERS